MTVPAPVRVLVVDDEALMRAGLRLMIDGAEGITVVGEASDGSAVPAAVRELDPDVVLMDIRMPSVDGIAATGALTRSGSRARVVILTAFDTDALLRDALLEGAVSFVLKDAEPALVIRAIHEAAAGRASFSPNTLARLVTMATTSEVRPAARGPLSAGHGVDVTDLVTPREWEVGRLVAQGFTNGEIGTALHIGAATAKTHISNLFAKLQVANRVQLAIRVLEHDAAD
jgi:DNA-binding NarL/FixJ family response regulator